MYLLFYINKFVLNFEHSEFSNTKSNKYVISCFGKDVYLNRNNYFRNTITMGHLPILAKLHSNESIYYTNIQKHCTEHTLHVRSTNPQICIT